MRPLMDRLNKRDRGGGGDIRISGGEGWTVETRVSFMLCTHIYTHTDRQTHIHTSTCASLAGEVG